MVCVVIFEINFGNKMLVVLVGLEWKVVFVSGLFGLCGVNLVNLVGVYGYINGRVYKGKVFLFVIFVVVLLDELWEM